MLFRSAEVEELRAREIATRTRRLAEQLREADAENIEIGSDTESDFTVDLEANRAEVIDIKKLGEDVQRFKSVKTLVEYTPGSIKLEKLKGMGNTVSILGFIVFALAAIGLLVCCYNCRCCCCTPFRGLYKTFRMMNVCRKCIVRKNEKIENDTATTEIGRAHV